jgi:antirestriction protein ArdC
MLATRYTKEESPMADIDDQTDTTKSVGALWYADNEETVLYYSAEELVEAYRRELVSHSPGVVFFRDVEDKELERKLNEVFEKMRDYLLAREQQEQLATFPEANRPDFGSVDDWPNRRLDNAPEAYFFGHNYEDLISDSSIEQEHTVITDIKEATIMPEETKKAQEQIATEAKERDYRKDVTDTIIRHMEAGTAPWQQPGNPAPRPRYAESGVPIAGANALYLMIKAQERGHGDDPRWCTFDKASEQGWSVKKGEKATHVEFTKYFDKTGEKLAEPKICYCKLFHASQLAKIPEYKPPEKDLSPQAAIGTAEKVLANSGANIHVGEEFPNPLYVTAVDEIHLPSKDTFPEEKEYYATALRELAHWTGHEERLNRKVGNYGLSGHFKEELRAELATFLASKEVGTPFAPNIEAEKSWLEILKNSKDEIFNAARDADRIVNQLVGFAQDQVMKETHSVEIGAPATIEKPAATIDEQLKAPDFDDNRFQKLLDTNVPDNSTKLTARQEYTLYVQSAVLQDGRAINDAEAAKALFNKGYEKAKVFDVMTKYSPLNKGGRIEYSRSVIDTVLTPEFQKELKSLKSKKLSA